jgi:hypothetical protein
MVKLNPCDSLIVGYLKLMGRSWRERISSERTYFFALVAADYEGATDTKGKHEEDVRTEPVDAKMMREGLASMKASLERLHAKVEALHKAAGLEASSETKTQT